MGSDVVHIIDISSLAAVYVTVSLACGTVSLLVTVSSVVIVSFVVTVFSVVIVSPVVTV